MKKSVLLLVLLVVLLGLAVGVAHFMMPKSGGQIIVPPNEPVSSLRTVTGMFTCLPHKNTDGPQTMECAYGMKADDGLYYALDWSQRPESAFDLPMDRPYTVTGLYVPVEALSSDHWRNYNIRGVIQVQEYKVIASGIPTATVGVPFRLELKKPTKIGNTTITVTAVLEDSRCPKDVMCIQAGRVRVAVSLESGSGKSASITLEPGQSATTETLSFKLDSVTPAKVSTHQTTDGEYRFTFTAQNK